MSSSTVSKKFLPPLDIDGSSALPLSGTGSPLHSPSGREYSVNQPPVESSNPLPPSFVPALQTLRDDLHRLHGSVLPTTANTSSGLGPREVIELNKYLTEMPGKVARVNLAKDILWKSLAAICLVATIAIFVVALCAYFGLFVVTGGLSYVLLGLVLLTPLLQYGMKKCYNLSKEPHVLYTQHKAIAQELETLRKSWNTAEIAQFFEEHGLSTTELPMDELRKLSDDPNQPLRALLPVIARYRYFAQEVEKEKKEIHADLFCDDRIQNEASANQTRENAWNRLEQRTLPQALHAALLLQVLQQPTLLAQAVHQTNQCPSLGWNYHAQTFGQRQFNNMLRNNDTYLSRGEGTDQERLDLAELCGTGENQNLAIQNLNPDHLRQKLFPDSTDSGSGLGPQQPQLEEEETVPAEQ